MSGVPNSGKKKMHSDRIPDSTGWQQSQQTGKSRKWENQSGAGAATAQKARLLLGSHTADGFSRMKNTSERTRRGLGVGVAPRLIIPVQHVSLTIATGQLQPSEI